VSGPRVSHYAEVLKVIRARVAELDISAETVDEIAGFPARYTSKVLAHPPIKNLSVFSLFSLLGAVALVPRLEHDAEMFARLKSRDLLPKKRRVQRLATVNRDGSVKIYISGDKMRENRRKGGTVRMAKLTPWQRRQLARKANKIRWGRTAAAPSVSPCAPSATTHG
jgi:hypothetical protein